MADSTRNVDPVVAMETQLLLLLRRLTVTQGIMVKTSQAKPNQEINIVYIEFAKHHIIVIQLYNKDRFFNCNEDGKPN